MNFIVSMDHYHDALTMGQIHLIEAIFQFGEQIINEGGKIVFQQEYTNAKPDIIAVFQTKEDLENWKERLKKLIPGFKS